MSDFKVEVVRIDAVDHHPNADRLSIITIGGYLCISAKLEDGSHRYAAGDLVVYIPEGAVMPEWMLKQMGFWDEAKSKGTLTSAAGNRVKAIRLRGVFSQGILYPVVMLDNEPFVEGEADTFDVGEGDDVAEFLGITKYEPKIPTHMAGQMGALYNVTLKYDFDSIQKRTTMFEPGELVVVTEKIHGTNIQIGYVPGLYPEGDDFYVTSKGLGARGNNLKDVPENDGNLYVQQFRKLRDFGVLEGMRVLSNLHGGQPVRLYGEVFGPGIQDLDYGQKDARAMFFDIQIGTMHLTPWQFEGAANFLGIETVPVLYDGPYLPEVIEPYRDGKDTIGGKHIREGVVIRAADGSWHPHHGRKIAKWVSPDYLLRKGNVTEFA